MYQMGLPTRITDMLKSDVDFMKILLVKDNVYSECLLWQEASV